MASTSSTPVLPFLAALTLLIALGVAAGACASKGAAPPGKPAVAPSPGGPAPPSDADIRALLEKRVTDGRTPILVVGVIDPDGKRRVVGHAAGGARADGSTLFEIGSITKVFTAALLADMVERGEVALEDPVEKYLPKGTRVPSRPGRPITLFELATHTSGLPRLPGNMAPQDRANPYADYTAPLLYEFLAAYNLPADGGDGKSAYSNLGAGLLGHALALRAGSSYEAAVRARLLAPLDMTSTAATLSPELRARLATGHDGAGKPVSNWDMDVLAGAGALRSTVDDQLKFLAANLDPGSAGAVGKALARLLVLRRPTPIQATEIGLGWHITRKNGREIVWHNGGTGGYHSFAAFDRAARTAVVVLSGSTNDIDDLGRHLIDPSFPLSVPPADRQEVAVDPAILDGYSGEYQLTPEFSIVVTREGAGLAVQATGQPRFPLFAESPVKFFLKVVDAQVTFTRDASGKVTGLILHQNGADVPGRKVK
jgi:serine-type D-Ala-D-Ala carboxypeptidase/endopeptidase